jgi:putative tryptophan/tyrosine transport system substrate-binding protein
MTTVTMRSAAGGVITGGWVVVRPALIWLAAAAVALFLAAPLAAGGQQATKVPRVGVLDYSPAWEPFRQALRELDYVEGQNIAIEYRSTEGRQELLREHATELVRLKVDVIVAAGTPSTLAAMQATTTIPIVMVSTGDPLRTGLVASLARPGGNVTGNTILGAELSGKRLQLLKDILPNVSRVAFLWNPANTSQVSHFNEIQAAARALALTLQSVEVRDPKEFDSAFVKMSRERPDALIMTADAMHRRHLARVVDFTASRRLPAMYQVKAYVEAGGLMSYGASQSDLYRRAAVYVDKILKGAKPGDLPVEQPTKFELVINLKTAKALGLTVPPSLLLQVDQVIE